MTKKVDGEIDSSSFRDPSGFVYRKAGVIYRQINTHYRKNYTLLMNSGLYEELVDSKLIVPYKEVDLSYAQTDQAYRIIRPRQIPFISYPYEWCFSQFKDAALVTLKIQKIALKHDMSLKDCSAYNIQFLRGKPVFVDTLSFEKYREGQPWVAYRQFCEHFLSPLALASYKDIRLNQLLRVNLDGVPLDLTNSLLPIRARLNFKLLTHIFLHAKSQTHFAAREVKLSRLRMSKISLTGLASDLQSAVEKLNWTSKKTTWVNYYDKSTYSESALANKKRIVDDFLGKRKLETVWDLGANVGIFSRLAKDKAKLVVSFDNDPTSVEKNYVNVKKNKETNILPLVLDLTNPSPSIGWGSEERTSLIDRGPADVVLALALVHHLAIANNVPLILVARFLSKICKKLIIEFVPKDDLQVKKMLSSREDIFRDYTRQTFEVEFKKYFRIRTSKKLKNSKRILYLMHSSSL